MWVGFRVPAWLCVSVCVVAENSLQRGSGDSACRGHAAESALQCWAGTRHRRKRHVGVATTHVPRWRATEASHGLHQLVQDSRAGTFSMDMFFLLFFVPMQKERNFLIILHRAYNFKAMIKICPSNNFFLSLPIPPHPPPPPTPPPSSPHPPFVCAAWASVANQHIPWLILKWLKKLSIVLPCSIVWTANTIHIKYQQHVNSMAAVQTRWRNPPSHPCPSQQQQQKQQRKLYA